MLLDRDEIGLGIAGVFDNTLLLCRYFLKSANSYSTFSFSTPFRGFLEEPSKISRFYKDLSAYLMEVLAEGVDGGL
jgi:hypothetical protein